MDNKKQLLINAGLKCFSINGYDKTSINDIVQTAGVAKGLLFYYYENKKQFYLSIVDYCAKILENIMGADKIVEKDFFNRIEQVMQKRIAFMIKTPYAYEFLMKAYFEESKQIKNELVEKLENIDLSQLNLYTNKVEKHKFQNAEDITACAKMIVWITDGIFKTSYASKEQLKRRVVELENYIKLLKVKFYKKEYLDE